MKFVWLLMLITSGSVIADAKVDLVDPHEHADGRELMELVYQKHKQYPYVYEEQSMILVDQNGNRQTRRLRRYTRVDQFGTARFLLVFDYPNDVKGVALLATRDSTGHTTQSMYLPAFGSNLIESEMSEAAQQGDHFLGTDFSVENIVGEIIDNHVHERQDDEVIDDASYYVINVYPLTYSDDIPIRRHYIRKDNLFIDRTDHFDELGRLTKRQTHHDLINVHGHMWRANMMMMDNFNPVNRTIIKVDQRVFSADYVPEEVFTKEWIFANQPVIETDTMETVADADSTTGAVN